MKIKFILPCFFPLLMICITSGAQQKTTLVYDFSKGLFADGDYSANGKLKPVPYGSFASVKIINVNTFRYMVDIQGKSVQYVTQVPSELQTIFRLPTATDTKKTNDAVANAKGAAATVSSHLEKLANEIQNLNKQFDFVKQWNSAVEALSPDKRKKQEEVFNVKPGDLLFVPENSYEAKQQLDFTARVNSAKNDQQIKEAVAIGQLIQEEMSISQKALQDFLDACKAFTEATQKAATIKLRRVELIDIAKQIWANYQKMQDILPSPLPETEMKDDFENFSNTYANVSSTAVIAKSTGSADEIKSNSDIVDKALKMIQDSYNAINEDGFLNLIRDVMVLQNAMDNPESFNVVSPSIQIDGDFIDFQIKATPSKANDLQNYISEKTFPIEIPVKGGWKTDFSVGPVISFGNSSRSEKYFLAPVSNPDSMVLMQRNNNNAISPGLAAMMHFYQRSGKKVSWGGMFGVGAGFQSVSDANFSLYCGLSLILGKQEKIMISGGMSYLGVDRLKNKQYVEGQEYASSKIDITSVTEKVFKPSIFLSISYNLTNKVEVK